MKNITVFGGASPKPGEPAYEEARYLGQLLGAAGYTVQTGGYVGTMEAVSRGAAEAGGRVVAATCDEIEAWRSIGTNAWVQEERRFVTLRERLYNLIESCDAALALGGGSGTLAEIAMLWNHLLIGALSPRPLILIGADWQAVMDSLYENLGDYIPEEQRAWLTFAPDVETAVRLLAAS